MKHRKPSLKRGLALAAAGAVAVGVISVVPAAMAEPNTASPYHIDGFVPYSAPTQEPDNDAEKFDDTFGSADELGPVNSSATKLGVIHTAAKPMLATTNPNAQVDLRRVWLDTTTVANGDVWLYLGFERDSNKGSGVIQYEFQKGARPAGCDYNQTDTQLIANCNPFSNRAPGDFILVFDQSGSSAVIGSRTWALDVDTDHDGVYEPSLGDTLKLGATQPLSGSVNAEAKFSTDKFFGEATVNLSKTIFPATPTSCFTVGNIIPGTITGNSDTADYKDVILKDFASQLRISNCGAVTVKKVTVPADGTGTFNYELKRADNSALNYAQPPATSITGVLEGHNVTDTLSDLKAGTNYQLSETFGANTPYDLTSIVCTPSGGSPITVTAGQQFPVVASETTACVITNTLKQGTLNVVKVVNNDHGGTLGYGNFQFTVDGVNPTGYQNGPTTFDPDGSNALTVNAGTYNVAEANLPIAGYSTTYAYGSATSCSAVVVPAGGSATCTITNSDIQPRLTVTKQVDNNYGGLLTADDFKLFVGTTQVKSEETNGFNVGSYVVSEEQQPGYEASSWGGDCDATGHVSLALADNKTCIITNSDIRPTLTVIKTVVNDNGGKLEVADFPLFVNGNSVTSGEANGLSVGTYTVTETQKDGYAASVWGGDCAADGTVTLALDEDKVCTITNDDIGPKLTVTKTVINNNGGILEVKDFPLFVDQTAVTSGIKNAFKAGSYTVSETNQPGYAAGTWGGACATDGTITLKLGDDVECTITNNDIGPKLTVTKTVVNDNGGTLKVEDFPLLVGLTPVTSGVTNGFDAGSYTVSETNQPGYAAGDWGGACAADGTVSLALGEDKTCTITNDDIQPTLKVVKTVINDNGGSLQVSDFPLSVSGTSVTSGVVTGFNVGNYTVSEQSKPGYAEGLWGTDCAEDGTVSLALAQNKVCTITNDDIQPKLTVVKTVLNDNGGVLEVKDFPLFVNTTSVTSGVTNGFNVGNYTVSETNQPGYTAGAWGGACAADGTIALKLGDDVTCTITNRDDKASPTGDTVQRWVLHDSLSIDGLRPAAPDQATAKATFTVYDDPTCSDLSKVGSETVAVTDSSATTATGIPVSATGDYYWRVQYTGDQFNAGFTTACGSEISRILAKDYVHGSDLP